VRFSLIDNQDRFGNAYHPAVANATVIEKEIWDEILRALQMPVTTKTANYGASDDDYIILVDASAGNVTITLPTAVAAAGSGNGRSTFIIKRIDNVLTNTVTIATSNSQTIDGAATATLVLQYQSMTVISNNANWFKV